VFKVLVGVPWFTKGCTSHPPLILLWVIIMDYDDTIIVEDCDEHSDAC
jgi:hypothetical protein